MKQEIIRQGQTWILADYLSIIPKDKPTPDHGFLYILEIGDCLRIGSTANLRLHLRAQIYQLQTYSTLSVGRFAFSPPHLNFTENRKLLHRHFAPFRKGKAEIYALTPEEFFRQLPLLSYFDQLVLQRGMANVER